MERYSVLENREIVLLKGKPCFWGKCSFCDYINDNSKNDEEMDTINRKIIDKITGEKGVLEVINSGSCFELTEKTLDMIKQKIIEKNIKKLYLESHWNYKNYLDDMRLFFGIPIIFKIGVETFDNVFRNEFLNKNAKFNSAKEVSDYFDSPCLMVGIKGQTKQMIRKDIELLLKYFKYGTINIFTENSTNIKRDDKLVEWFVKEYKFLKDKENIDFLYENTDFGVGE
jgi:hypothetical protein